VILHQKHPDMKGDAPDCPAVWVSEQKETSFQCIVVLPSVHSCSGTARRHDSSVFRFCLFSACRAYAVHCPAS
jgi:hypothetical protein